MRSTHTTGLGCFTSTREVVDHLTGWGCRTLPVMSGKVSGRFLFVHFRGHGAASPSPP